MHLAKLWRHCPHDGSIARLMAQVMNLAKRLAVQIPCEYVLLVPNTAGDPSGTATVPFVVSGAEAASHGRLMLGY